MKARLFQLEVAPGHPVKNTQHMLQAINAARQDGIDLIVFPEMSIPGYLLGDEWERTAFLRECELCTQEIVAASDRITVAFGNVVVDWSKKNEDGRPRKYNALLVAEDRQLLLNPGTLQPFFIKTLMANYREFDDSRHFYDPRKLAWEMGCAIEDLIHPAPSRLGKLGCILCEDGWDDDYNISPLTLLAGRKAELFINISASPYTLDKNHKRNRVFSAHCRQHGIPLLYVNNLGIQDNGKTIFTFDGASCGYDSQGRIIGQLPAFSEQHLDLEPFRANPAVAERVHDESPIAIQYQAVHYGTQKFLDRTGISRVVIGVSGGIDSALVASIYRQILPPEQMLLVSMPGPFTSSTTRSLAQQLARNLDCPFAELPIGEAVDLTRQQLLDTGFRQSDGTGFTLPVSDFVMENIQARDRSARVLAACAAAFGGVFTCNGNKSEITVGYSTLYGDLSGFLANIGDLWKGEVYQMASFINREIYGREVIPQGTLDVVPSAELSAAHDVDQGQGDPLFYPYHDALFRSWVERWERATPEDNLRWYLDGTLEQEIGYDGRVTELFEHATAFIKDLEYWWNQYQGMAIAKRIQAPPVLAIKRRAFGFDHREAQIGPRYTRAYLQMKADATSSSGGA